jgi:hypothetical protein
VACAKYNKLSKNNMAEVERAFRMDASDLKVSFHRALSLSIPPPAFYRNCRPGAYSEPIFGVPLGNLEANQDNVSKVMRMCIVEVESRGLDAKDIYSVSWSRGIMLGFMFSVTVGSYTRHRSTGGKLNPLPMMKLLVDMNSNSVAAQV